MRRGSDQNPHNVRRCVCWLGAPAPASEMDPAVEQETAFSEPQLGLDQSSTQTSDAWQMITDRPTSRLACLSGQNS